MMRRLDQRGNIPSEHSAFYYLIFIHLGDLFRETGGQEESLRSNKEYGKILHINFYTTYYAVIVLIMQLFNQSCFV